MGRLHSVCAAQRQIQTTKCANSSSASENSTPTFSPYTIHHLHGLGFEPINNTSLVFTAVQLAQQTDFQSITYNTTTSRRKLNSNETQTQAKSKRHKRVSSDENAQTLMSTILLMYSFTFKSAFNVRTSVQNFYIIDFLVQ